MNLSRANVLALFKGLSVYKFSPRRAILSFTGTTIAAGFIFPQAHASFELYCSETEENKERIDRCPSIKKGIYTPTLYLANGMLQAIWASRVASFDPNIQFVEDILDLPCGGKIGMQWASHLFPTQSLNGKRKGVVIILPGLTASAKEPYIKNIATEALNNGYEVVVYHNRGNEVEMKLPVNGFLNPVDDFKFAVEYVKTKYPDHNIFAVGHSFGANTLVNYMGKYKDESPIKAAASIANPFHFIKASFGVLNTAFDGYLADILQEWARKNKDAFCNAPKHYNLDYEKAMTVRSIVGFDECITRRLLGYSSFIDYYESTSSVNALKDINVPLLCMNSRDDPILHHSSIPISESVKNKNVTMLITKRGGHVGWFQGFFKPKRWFPKPTVEFINACYDDIAQKKAQNPN